MQLVILHYHFRTGGVCRVIELGTAALSSALGCSLTEVVLVGGEALASTWLRMFRERTNGRLLLHHHDWWFDHRWSRWSEMKISGYRSIQEVAKILLPNKPFIRHATINHRDFSILNRQDILIDTHLFDWSLEQARQKERFKKWRAALPKQVQNLVHSPPWLSRTSAPSSLAFSRLTCEAQIEVPSQSVAQSWRRCAPLNPFFTKWRRRAAEGRLQSPPWATQAGRWLSGAAYTERLLRLAEKDSPPAAPVRIPRPKRVADSIESQRCQNELIRTASRPEYMFPLLWTR